MTPKNLEKNSGFRGVVCHGFEEYNFPLIRHLEVLLTPERPGDRPGNHG
jgi:hypothetical protein